MSKIHRLKHKIVPTLTGVLISLTVLLPTPAKANVLLGVVRSSSNSDRWNQITNRLQASAIGYQAIALEEINSIEDLKEISVLFLPEVETLSDNQLKILQEWVSQGGRLIASGPIGRKSSAGVRQQLRSLLGSYWAFELNQPTTPQGLYRCLDISCKESTSWVPQQKTNVTVQGAVLIPSGLNSNTAATWEGGVGSSAVIVTSQATYLGWYWGESADASVDTAWMQAILKHYSDSLESPLQKADTQTTDTNTAVVESLPSLIEQLNDSGNSDRPRDNQLTATETLPRRRPITDLIKTLPSRPDPSEQSAPPGLEVEQGPKPITNSELNVMVDELKHLLNRFENATIAANSAQLDLELTTESNDGGNLLASTRTEGALIARAGTRWKEEIAEIVTKTQRVIEELPQYVREKKYDLARQQWLDVRELIWKNYPRDGIRPGGEIRAVWLDRGTIVAARNPQGLAAVFNRLAAAGINTVFFETVNAGYAIYPSNIAPKQNPLTLGWDPLEAAVKLAKERNMELHAWIWTFAVGNKAHNAVANQPEDYLGPVITAHPTWLMTDNQGRQRHPNDGKTYMDPANPYVRQYLMQLIDEIASRYKVDGIHLDYIRYPFQDPGANFTHGYGSYGRLEFQKLNGVDPIEISPTSDRQMWWKWTEYRIERVNTFVANVSQMLRLRYPDVILSAAVFPLPKQERLWKIQQDWETWTQRGDVDLLTPMTYALDTNRLQQLAESLTNKEHLGNALIAPAIKLLNISEIVAIDQVQALRDLPTGGYSIFAAEKINGEFERFLLRTQGPESARDSRDFSFVSTSRRPHVVEGPIPYRQPFVAAVARYQALKQEWGFLLAEEQLEITTSALQDLRSRSRDLEKALERLAKSPSAKSLEEAKRSLGKLQSEFSSYMRSQANERPLQVQTWENRLAALEMLLNYGEQVRLKNQRF